MALAKSPLPNATAIQMRRFIEPSVARRRDGGKCDCAATLPCADSQQAEAPKRPRYRGGSPRRHARAGIVRSRTLIDEERRHESGPVTT
jgi:hypothetical protein